MNIQHAIPRVCPDPDNDPAGAPVIGALHLVLGATALIAFLADADAVRALPRFAWPIFLGFAANNIYLYIQAHRSDPASDSRATLWLGLFWYSAMVYVTGGARSFFFPFYLFNILISAFRFGFVDSIRITLGSVAMFSLTGLAADDASEQVQVLLRCAFLLSFGYLIAVWGEANLRQKRGLSLLREVSSLSNPRFGIDRTIDSIMERCRVFFQADICVLVSHRQRSRRWLLRIARADGPLNAPIGGALAPALMAAPGADIVICRRRPFSLSKGVRYRAYDAANRTWRAGAADQGREIAELLEGDNFVSVPLNFRSGQGRVYITSSRRALNQNDAIFLAQIVAQVLPVIETVHLLDRLASRAALRERRTIAHDLHDSTVQPYIGLSHTLAGLRNKTAPDNPLKADIDAISTMAEQVVADLRGFAEAFARHGAAGEHVVEGALRRTLSKAKQFYGVDIALEISGEHQIGDRLAAAVLQLGSEGISNICKHTEARHGTLRIACQGAWLHMEIENECARPARPFVPASLAARSTALGGTIRVEHRAPGPTVVHIDIPV